jgi:hypothetical protein
MMAKTNTGGPAFHVFPDTEVGHAAAFRGMTMRDYFAAKAMQGFMEMGRFHGPEQCSVDAFELADAMLKARESK